MNFRLANPDDSALLAELNHQLIRDEGHRNPMTVPELEQRMRGWLASEYAAVIFENHGEVVAYALYREQADEIYLRQLFVVRNCRRQGLGRASFEILRTKIWPTSKRLTVDVLAHNRAGVAFWRAVGYQDYSLKLEILPEAHELAFSSVRAPQQRLQRVQVYELDHIRSFLCRSASGVQKI
jgi:predicted acetyltransferase